MRLLATGRRSRRGDATDDGARVGGPSVSERVAPGTFVPGFWLSRCEGFRVDDRRGPLGFVESVVMGDPLRGPRALIVVESRPGGRRHYVPVLDVGVVQSVAERVVLRRAFAQGPGSRQDAAAAVRTSVADTDSRVDCHGGSEMRAQTGTVKAFNSLSGHGMIVADETGDALWVHQRNVLGDSPALSEGDRVEYEKRNGGMGPEAVNVRFPPSVESCQP